MEAHLRQAIEDVLTSTFSQQGENFSLFCTPEDDDTVYSSTPSPSLYPLRLLKGPAPFSRFPAFEEEYTPYACPSTECESDTEYPSRPSSACDSKYHRDIKDTSDVLPCIFFAKKGHCKYGDFCKYSHKKDLCSQYQSIWNEHIEALKERGLYKVKDCVQFADKGYCHKGTYCTFKHGNF